MSPSTGEINEFKGVKFPKSKQMNRRTKRGEKKRKFGKMKVKNHRNAEERKKGEDEK